jgi:DNA polymerase
MQFYAIDFETHYDSKTYTLKKMSTDAYIYDPRFEALCLSIYSNNTQVILPQEAIAGWLKSVDPRKVGFIAQHAHFDGAILWRHFGFSPAFWVDTLSMSKAIHGLGVRHSLAEQCKRYGLAPKTVDYGAFDGKRWAHLSHWERENLGEQCMDDSERTYKIAQEQIRRMPDEELRIIDMTVRMFTEPMLVGDAPRLRALVTEENRRKAELLQDLGLTAKDLCSDTKFENLLLSLGQEVMYKPAKSDKRGFKGAFAKSDEYMQGLAASSDELIQTLAQLRLDVKSTIQLTRAERFLAMAERGPLPVYYYYYGARNSRFAGGEGTNFQNLPSRGKNGTVLRESIQAPEGHVLVVADLSQIECRMEMAIAGQFDKLVAFRERRDLYCELGTKLYGWTVTKENILERQLAKTILLQCGYGSGWLKVQQTAKRLFGLDMSEDEARYFLSVYRNDNLAICGYPEGKRRVNGLWQKADDWLKFLSQGWTVEYFAPQEPGFPASAKPLFVIKDHKVILPNGLMLHYDNLHWGVHPSPKGDSRPGWLLPRADGCMEFFYGAKLVQNINSALSRLVLTQAQLRVLDRTPWGRMVLHTHDDTGLCCPGQYSGTANKIMKEELTRAPEWLPNIPLAVECQVRKDYAK